MFQDLVTFFVNALPLYFGWMPSYMAIAFIFLFGVAFIFVTFKIIITILKMIPFL